MMVVVQTIEEIKFECLVFKTVNSHSQKGMLSKTKAILTKQSFSLGNGGGGCVLYKLCGETTMMEGR